MLPSFDDAVFTRRDALARGASDTTLRADRDRGRLDRVRPGVYAAASAWKDLASEERARWAAAAAHEAGRGAPIVFSHLSAAALWGLPLFRVRATRAHVTVDGPARSTPQVFRHRLPLPPADVVWLESGRLGVTTLARTVADVIATVPFEAGVSLADAALRTVATNATGAIDLERAEDLREEITDHLRRRTGRRGIRAARFVTEFADARAQLPGESVSRLLLRELGFADPELQVPVSGPRGADYLIDFDLGTVWGEFDGAAKYTDPRFLNGRTPARALADEKEREDWIRGVTGKRIVRWQMPHLATSSTFRRHLAACGVSPRHA